MSIRSFIGAACAAIAIVALAGMRGATDRERRHHLLYRGRRLRLLPAVPRQPLDVDVASRSVADLLAVEWSRLRTRPNISNCFDSGRKNACGDF